MRAVYGLVKVRLTISPIRSWSTVSTPKFVWSHFLSEWR